MSMAVDQALGDVPVTEPRLARGVRSGVEHRCPCADPGPEEVRSPCPAGAGQGLRACAVRQQLIAQVWESPRSLATPL